MATASCGVLARIFPLVQILRLSWLMLIGTTGFCGPSNPPHSLTQSSEPQRGNTMTHTEDTMQFSQDELRQFVDNEVYLNQSHLVEHLLSEGVFSYDEIENLYRTPDMDECTFTIDIEQEDIPVRGNAMASGDEDVDRKYEDEILERLERGDTWAWCTVRVTCEYDGAEGSEYLGGCTYDDEDAFRAGDYFEDMKQEAYDRMIEDYDLEEPQEVYEWWAVSPTLLRELAEQGEPVLRTDYGEWWGRTTTGQAIFLDSVITEIKSDIRQRVETA